MALPLEKADYKSVPVCDLLGTGDTSDRSFPGSITYGRWVLPL